MKPNELIGLVTAATAALIIFLAWLIKYRKKVNLVSGYDEQLYPDKDGLANWVGGTLFITGLISLTLALAMVIFSQFLLVFAVLFALTLLIGPLMAAIGGNKYKVKD